MGCKAIGVYLASFTVRLVEDVLHGDTKGGQIACSGKIIKLLISYVREVQFPESQILLLMPVTS